MISFCIVHSVYILYGRVCLKNKLFAIVIANTIFSSPLNPADSMDAHN